MFTVDFLSFIFFGPDTSVLASLPAWDARDFFRTRAIGKSAPGPTALFEYISRRFFVDTKYRMRFPRFIFCYPH